MEKDKGFNMRMLIRDLLVVGLIVFIGLIFGAVEISYNKKPLKWDKQGEVSTLETPCYLYEKPSEWGFGYNRIMLSIEIRGKDVNGHLSYKFPYKDIRSGDFEGLITSTDEATGERAAEVVWSIKEKEGSIKTEELHINLQENKAFIELKEGVVDGSQLDNINCYSYNEKIVVHVYIQENIETLAVKDSLDEKRWYFKDALIDPESNSAIFKYGNGQIDKTAQLQYSFDEDKRVIIEKVLLLETEL